MASWKFAGLYADAFVNTLSGVPLRLTQATVYQSDGVTVATLYTDRTKATTAPNPITTDNYGNGSFYADPGIYIVSCLGVTIAVEVTQDQAETSVNGTAATLSAGTGSPAGVVTAAVGSIWLRTDGGANTTLYVKESGAGTSGWVAK